ncbi:hypothetical protein P262_05583 [Cronobacter malonaticus]|uniref:Uncharacterized protein n=1 Tax=Cronobacter malonaticus TaxID=413503 RepID=V5U5B2_9ENTR|nr:hypothetical protein P262_05583 [Cronobacter malonaticus]CCJ94720.1 FIG00554771: hypothetical protein [Cronobacter malonaticus 681]CCK00048.1 FIG00554771: hypothetical protein [Cronobacter malonaticus 507]
MLTHSVVLRRYAKFHLSFLAPFGTARYSVFWLFIYDSCFL